MARRAPSNDGVSAISVLIADGDGDRLERMLAVARDARFFVYGARAMQVALTMIERHGVDVALISAQFDGGRALELAQRTGCRVVRVMFDPPKPGSGEGFEQVITWPFTPDSLREALSRPIRPGRRG